MAEHGGETDMGEGEMAAGRRGSDVSDFCCAASTGGAPARKQPSEGQAGDTGHIRAIASTHD